MYIPRVQLLNKLVSYRDKDLVKTITGIRRCGKSVLLNDLYYSYLISEGVPDDHIIKIAFDLKNRHSKRPHRLSSGRTNSYHRESGVH